VQWKRVFLEVSAYQARCLIHARARGRFHCCGQSLAVSVPLESKDGHLLKNQCSY
jgi:hypothetical protein